MQTIARSLYEKLMDGYQSKLSHSGISGERFAQRLDALSKIGYVESGGVTRPGYSLLEKQAKELVISWMEAAGLTVTIDGAGNVFGKLAGQSEGPSVVSGSHLDSVPNGGHFDGPLGVLAALEVAEAWKEKGYVPEKPYEIAIFSDEEGSRFKSGLTGSRAYMGKFSFEEVTGLRDEAGNSFEEVITAYGSNVERYLEPGKQTRMIDTFVELHIEQGKVLEKEDKPVGIVSGIAGPAWVEVTFIGEAGHAGNTPMIGRKDPMIAAGQFIQAIEEFPKQVSDTAVATIGKINASPNGVNVIAQQVEMIVDIRDIYEETRDALIDLVEKKAKAIAADRQIEMDFKVQTKVKPLPIAKNLQEKLAHALGKFDIDPVYIPSGAGHDAMILGEQVPAAMLFARSKDGISHNPREWTSLNDCVSAVHVLKAFIEDIMVD